MFIAQNFANQVAQDQAGAAQVVAATGAPPTGPAPTTAPPIGAGLGSAAGTGAPTTYSGPAEWGGVSPGTPQAEQFATAVISGLGAKSTQKNLDLMRAWFAAEGTSATNNPLATTLDGYGGVSFNSVGVKNYPSLEAGVKATIRTLQSSYYTHIVELMQTGKIRPMQIFRQAEDEFNIWRSGNPNAPGHYILGDILKGMRNDNKA
jgi:hypothetical protein